MATISTPTPLTSPPTSLKSTAVQTNTTIHTGNSIQLTKGQILNIFILQNTQNQSTFTIAGQNFTANTPTPIAETGNLRVQVKETYPTLQLVLLPKKGKQAELSSQSQTLIQNTLRSSLPNQISLSHAFQILSQPSFLQLLPPNIQSQLQSLFNNLLKPSQNLKTENLKTSIQNSGLFFENSLKNKSPNLKDIKAKLLQLQHSTNQSNLTESTSKLATLLEKTINKITIQQIQLLENPQTIQITPPLHPQSKIKSIEVDIRKHPNEGSSHYEALLKLALEEGEIVSKIILNKEDSVSTYIWGSNTFLERQIEHNLPNLLISLKEAGIKTSTITLSKVQPSTNQKTKKIALIDIHI